MYLLDTNTCIFIKNNRPMHVLDKLKKSINKGVYLSSISIAELQYGVHNSSNIERNKISLIEFLAPFDILDFDDNDAEQFGMLRAQLKKQGQLIGPYDMLIAGQALAKKLILVTNNIKEFSRIDGLEIEDWK